MSKVLATVATIVLLGLGSGCGPSAKGLRGDHFFEHAEYRKAAAAYEGALASGATPSGADRMLLRLSLAYLLIDKAQSKEADETLHRLLSQHPGSDQRPLAVALRRLVQRISHLTEARQRSRAQLESLRAEVDSYREQTETLKGALESEERRLSTATSQGEQHATEVEALQLKIARQQERIERLKRSLAALKRIDMQRSR